MRVLVCARSDEASVNIRDRLLEAGGWERTGRTFRGAPMWARSEAVLVEVEGPSVTDEALWPDLQQLALPVRDVWFLSRHRAASGTPSLTVHPIGNHTRAAEVGGRPETLSQASPRDMGALLRCLARRRDEAGLDHEVTYEATHHGPYMGCPTLFVEIGSDERWYSHRPTAQVAALAIEDALSGLGMTHAPVLVGVGYGHYMPRMTQRALRGEADFGHLLPRHALEEGAGADAMRRAVAATPGCQGVHIPKKDLSATQRHAVRQWLEALDVPTWP